MRISVCSSDVCSSDLKIVLEEDEPMSNFCGRSPTSAVGTDAEGLMKRYCFDPDDLPETAGSLGSAGEQQDIGRACGQDFPFHAQQTKGFSATGSSDPACFGDCRSYTLLSFEVLQGVRT